MTTDTTAEPITADAEAGGYLATGSPGRMAALLLMARRPEGVSSVDIRDAIRAADPRVFDEDRLKRVLRLLREAGLAATERDDAGLRWYSPAARQAAKVRRGWQPSTACCAA